MDCPMLVQPVSACQILAGAIGGRASHPPGLLEDGKNGELSVMEISLCCFTSLSNLRKQDERQRLRNPRLSP